MYKQQDRTTRWCNMNPHAEALIHKLDLHPHPEGGYYRETYRAPLQVQSPHHVGARCALTSIYFLLDGTQHSAWHRVASDESWFFHLGADLHIYTLVPNPDGSSNAVRARTLGLSNQCFETTITAGSWFAAKPADGDSFSLVSCVVGPGFEFEDFELASREKLVAEGYERHPDWRLIEPLLTTSSL